MKILLFFFISSTFIAGSCNTDTNNDSDLTEISIDNSTEETNVDTFTNTEEESSNNESAKITSVTTTGEVTDYTFSVGIESIETGCGQYANWWEIVTEEGELIYRRILAHSHVDEQPFIRSGSGVNVTENQELIIRAHMNTSGYGTQVFKGNIASGFNESVIEEGFADDLATQAPLPDDCAF